MDSNKTPSHLNRYLVCALGYIFLASSCTGNKPAKDPLAYVLASKNPKIKRVMDSLDQYELQIRYTQIHRRNDSVFFSDYDFQVDKDNYFYPASTVKFPLAVLALEKLNGMDSLSMDTPFYVVGDSVKTTFAKEISKIFAVSDNDANNRLVEFLGQDYINQKLREKGIVPVRISHRLSTPNSEAVVTKPLILYLNDSVTETLPGTINTIPKALKLNSITKGKGFYDGDSLIGKPFDFSLKNYYPIAAQHGVLKRVIFPQKFPKKEQFHINAEQRRFLLSAMHTLPKDAGYDPKVYYDGYVKFFLYGDTKENIPENMKLYNKVGDAYGTLTDCAYITDTKNGVEFLLTATILVNKNGIFNDNVYAYDEIGFPFMAALGRELYKYELDRKKSSSPGHN